MLDLYVEVNIIPTVVLAARTPVGILYPSSYIHPRILYFITLGAPALGISQQVDTAKDHTCVILTQYHPPRATSLHQTPRATSKVERANSKTKRCLECGAWR